MDVNTVSAIRFIGGMLFSWILIMLMIKKANRTVEPEYAPKKG